MLSAFGYPVVTCCDMLGIENRTSAHARAQHCCTKLAQRPHHATYTDVAVVWPGLKIDDRRFLSMPTARFLSKDCWHAYKSQIPV